MFSTLGVINPPAVLANVTNALNTSGVGRPGYPEPLQFRKPFPVQVQQWSMFQPLGRIFTVFPEGWRHQEFEYCFIPRFFPVTEQLFRPNSGNPGISSWF